MGSSSWILAEFAQSEYFTTMYVTMYKQLKDVLEKGLKQRGVKGCNAIKQLLNSIKFSPPKSVRGMGELGDHGGPDPAVSLPLMVSCMFAYDDCTAVLLEYGADPNVADEV
eukprot:858561-Pelagomonas_calceolata.AAC.1